MSVPERSSPTLRRATAEDIDAILDLLTEYDQPRAYFEPFYLNDSSYQPDHSWVVEEQGHLLSHLRIFDRVLQLRGVAVRIAGIGNVITANAARGRGYVGQLLRTVLTELPKEGYVYSLLWTHLPELYQRYGWVPLKQEVLKAQLTHQSAAEIQVSPYEAQQLSAIQHLYTLCNTHRSGAIIRSDAYWNEQPTWLHEQPGQFLIAQDVQSGRPLAYGRGRAREEKIKLLEFGMEPACLDAGRMLLATLAEQCHGALEGRVPEALRSVFYSGEVTLLPDTSFMGLTLSMAALVDLLRPQWMLRLQQGGVTQGELNVATSAGSVRVNLTGTAIQREQRSPQQPELLSAPAFAHLLFFGWDQEAKGLLGARSDEGLLQALFPAQDCTIWQADEF